MNGSDRVPKAIRLLEQLTKKRMNVIFIDEELKKGVCSFLADYQFHSGAELVVFNDPTPLSNDRNMDNLSRLADTDKLMVIHTSLAFARGTDFKMRKAAHVLLGFEPLNMAALTQALGRGVRSFNKKTTCSFLLDHNSTLAGLTFEGIMQRLMNKEIKRQMEVKVRYMLRMVIHEKRMFLNTADKGKLLKLLAIPPNLTLITSDNDEYGFENWAFLVKKIRKLPENQ